MEPRGLAAMFPLADALALAVQHHQAGRLQAAEQIYHQILTTNPNHPDALHLLGVIAFQSGDYDLAVDYITRAIKVNGAVAKFHCNLGNVFQAERKLDEAIRSFRHALQLDPQFAEAFHNLGSALADNDQLGEAVNAYRRSLKLKPYSAETWTNLGVALTAQGKIEEAVASFDSALQTNPSNVDARGNRALLWLLQGDFHRGWREYEWRWKSNQLHRQDFAQPGWDGSPLSSRTILLHSEQGLGDTLQFVRYASLVKQQNPAAKVVVGCQRRLTNLLSRCPAIDKVVGAGDPLPPFDVHSPLLSLPGIFQTTLETIPAQVPYLFPDPKLVVHWRNKLGNVRGLRIGINWQGRFGEGEFRKRNIPLELFASLAKLPGVQLISLQKREANESHFQQNTPFTVFDPGPEFDTVHGAFEDSAAIMMNLDLVITSDTSVPHLAGALGVPVWLALPFVPDWRWLQNRWDSPWYPTMRLFRQQAAGNWSGVFEAMRVELSNLVAGRS